MAIRSGHGPALARFRLAIMTNPSTCDGRHAHAIGPVGQPIAPFGKVDFIVMMTCFTFFNGPRDVARRGVGKTQD